MLNVFIFIFSLGLSLSLGLARICISFAKSVTVIISAVINAVALVIIALVADATEL